MAQRDGSIFLYLFIGSLFLFGIMATLFFFSVSEQAQLTAKLDDTERKLSGQREDHRSVTRDLTELRILVGGATYEDSPWPDNSVFKQRLQEGIQKEVNDALKELGQGPREYAYIVEPFEDIPDVLRTLRTRLGEVKAQASAETDARSQQTETHKQTVSDLRRQNVDHLEQAGVLEAKIEELDSACREKEEELLQKIEDLNDQMSYEILSLKRSLSFKENQMRGVQNRLDAILEEARKEKTFDDSEPDAKILSVLSESQKAWVGIGRKQHLQKGLIFRVFEVGSGGRRVYKGSAEVRRVDDELAEVRLEEEDSLNPISEGDFIASPFYDPGKTPVFVFAGTGLASKNVTKDYLESKIRSYGGDIRAAVDLNTDYVVLTQNYQSSAQYRTARELGVAVMRERDLLEFIGR